MNETLLYIFRNYQKIYIKCDKISEKSAECTAEIRESEKIYILNMTSKLVDSHTAPKTYWTLLNRFLYNKKIPSIPLLLVDGKIVSDFYEKSNIFNNFFCITMYSNKKMQGPCHPLRTGQTPE